jgi:hypothetical protein
VPDSTLLAGKTPDKRKGQPFEKDHEIFKKVHAGAMRQTGVNRRPAIIIALAIGNCHPVDTSHDDSPALNATGFRNLGVNAAFCYLVTAGSCLFLPVRPGRWPW